MTTITFNSLIAIYYLALFVGLLTIFLLFATPIIYLLNKLAKKYKFLFMIVEYNYYKKDFKIFFKEKYSVTGRFNKK